MVALLYFWQLQHLHPAGGSRLALWPVVALGVWVAYARPVPVRNRESSISVALSEIPALVGVVFLAPGPALLAISCGHLAASVRRRFSPVKALINWLVYLDGLACRHLRLRPQLGAAPR